MRFSVGDNVVHPHHGAGCVTSIGRRDLMDGLKRYYVIEIPRHSLTVHVPVDKADEVGVRPAIARSSLPQVLSALRSEPSLLPKDFQARQECTDAQFVPGLALQLAGLVRDLTWHRKRAHLTRTDFVNLRRGRDLLAAEMSLVSGDPVADAGRLIDSTMIAAIAGGFA